ncbi:tetratricopeptide repeat protein [Crocinitomicaceae bacterium CZZ-1]|uniref:Tetratricopeptide repeat protein n=1 Tax=Taishania pollutisoli TaxID=2766479 RepID=A0A8J6P4C0_9FLAO|nr:tetratricopeptide repeat protein [Taishania pollutisoli]MBC9811327.1 tetratricopeptide repeat protein [Taishania pollutisoli]MBX2947758.1 tetratricopeptide repeat protein [Crocinitomicaceae bacterium]NGF75109.1 tetratricopeptide repeat protein [Fluviicola sp. SGL-29]
MLENVTSEEIKRQFKSNKRLRLITFAVGGALVLIVGYLVYYQFVSVPKNKKSEDAYWNGLNLASKDSTDMAIEELTAQVKKYDGYKGGENAQFVLGRQYMEKGEFNKALETLEKVKVSDTYLSSMTLGLQGDCYSELKKYKEAAAKYKDAAKESINEWTTPMYLFKAGLCAEELQDFESALKLYEEIKNDYTTFANNKAIDKYIARVSNLKK